MARNVQSINGIRVRLYAISLAMYLLSNLATAAVWTANVDQQEGLPVLTKGGTTALSSGFVFWQKNWAWAGLQSEFKIDAPFQYTVVGKNTALDFDLASRIKKPTSQQLVWKFDLNSHSTLSDAIGGGISFKFDLATFGSELGEPELLPGNRGWAWGRERGSRVEMRFDPPLEAVYFERGQKSEVRAFFYKGDVPQGQRHYIATLSISSDMAIGPTQAERFGLDDPATWPSDIIDWDKSPVDLSFLNAPEKPAGKHGFLKAVKGKLVFGDGTPVRFWGTNITAYTLFGTPRDNVKQQAHRLSELGFNLVRLHHHDSPWVDPNIFGSQKAQNTQTLNAVMLDRLDWWIKCLKEEGIYVWLDLHVQRNLKPGDQIDGFDEIAKGNPQADLKGYNYVNKSIQQAMQRFNEAYVNHLNSYTNTRYKDEPAIAAMLITNENDITNHYANVLLPERRTLNKHSTLYMVQALSFAAKHFLSLNKTWRSWEPGPSKLFLNDLEQRFNIEMIAYLRAQGVKVPIITTSTWGGNPLSSLPALTVGDIIDAHAYGGVGELEKNPLYAANLVHWLAAAQVVGKPLTVTEWNVSPFPVPDRHTIPLFVAGSASLQGWDALMEYAYSQEPLTYQGTPSNWQAYNDPSLLATLPAAALLYRQSHVREATTTYAFSPTKEILFNQAITADNSVALRTAAERGKLVIVMPQTSELPWLEKSPVGQEAQILTDPRQSQLGADAKEVASDSGELDHNWEQGIFTINTPRTQAAMGWIGGRAESLSNVDISVSTRNATVAVQSLDGKPIDDSSSILISFAARSVPKAGNQMPYFSEPVEGNLTIHAAKGLKLYKKLAGSGEQHELAAPYKNGRYHIALDKKLMTYWLFLK